MMKYVTCIFLITVFFNCLMDCSLQQRRAFPALSLNDHDKSEKSSSENSDVCPMIAGEDMIQRRIMSRVYVALMEKLQTLKMKPKPQVQDFKTLCEEIEAYKQQHLESLAKNELLYDDGHNPKDNHFNSDLLRQLEQIAEKHKFPEEYIPFPVVQDGEMVSDDDEGETVRSEVWSYQDSHALSQCSICSSPRPRTSSKSL